jgi:alkylation response protein AidB-like acyl-CoA dehydrogenase
MNLDLTDEQEMLARAVRSALADVDAEAVRAAWGTTHLVDVYARLAAMGLLDLVVAARDAGEPRLVEVALVGRELGRVAAVTPIVATAALGAAALVAGGAEPEVAAVGAGAVWPLAASEPGRRELLAPAATRLEPVADGWRVTGEKHLVEHAGRAAGFVVTCAAPDGPALALVDAAAPGLTVTPDEIVGGAPVGRLALRDAPARLLARGPVARDALHAGWATALLLQAAHLAGAAARLVELTRDHVLARQQFGVPLATFQAVQHHLAGMKVAVDSAELMVMNTAWVGPGPDGLGLAAETKAWVAEAAADVARHAHEIHGGIGVVDDHEVSLLSRRIIAESALYGSPAQLWAIAGEALRGSLVGIPA